MKRRVITKNVLARNCAVEILICPRFEFGMNADLCVKLFGTRSNPFLCFRNLYGKAGEMSSLMLSSIFKTDIWEMSSAHIVNVRPPPKKNPFQCGALLLTKPPVRKEISPFRFLALPLMLLSQFLQKSHLARCGVCSFALPRSRESLWGGRRDGRGAKNFWRQEKERCNSVDFPTIL